MPKPQPAARRSPSSPPLAKTPARARSPSRPERERPHRSRRGRRVAGARRRGYKIRSVGNAPATPTSPASLVMFRPGFAGEGRRLARDLGVKQVGPLDGMRVALAPRRARRLHPRRLSTLTLTDSRTPRRRPRRGRCRAARPAPTACPTGRACTRCSGTCTPSTCFPQPELVEPEEVPRLRVLGLELDRRDVLLLRAASIARGAARRARARGAGRPRAG